MTSAAATLTLDLDDKWTYLRTHGCASWSSYPTYLPTVVPRIVEWLAERRLRMTCFLVGRDAANPALGQTLREISAAGHEVANHSFNHYPWLSSLSDSELTDEVVRSEEAITELAGRRPVGFRAPGFSGSPRLRELLAARGYEYDSSAWPTFLGPLLRAYSKSATRRASQGSVADVPLAEGSGAAPSATRSGPLFGSWRDGFGPLRPHATSCQTGALIEIPVTTMPLLRLPIHLTYLLHLRQAAGGAWRPYLRMAMAFCRWRGVAPSLLLHPLDFLGVEDEPELGFFPGMKLLREEKLAVVAETVKQTAAGFSWATMQEVAREVGIGLTSSPALVATQRAATS